MSIKQRFVKRILEDEGRRLLRNQTLAIGQKLKTRSGHLLGARNTSISNASTDGYGANSVCRHKCPKTKSVAPHKHSLVAREWRILGRRRKSQA